LDNPAGYRQAMEDKLESLLEQEGPRAETVVEDCLGDQIRLVPNQTTWELLQAVVHHPGVQRLLDRGNPESAEPAPEDEARAAVAAQPEVRLADLLELAAG